MTDKILTAVLGSGTGQSRSAVAFGPVPFSLLVLVIPALLMAAFPDSRPVILGAFTDAYLAVGVFVAVTLLLFNCLEVAFNFDLSGMLARYRVFQVPAASFLGALPGCGGAIMVVTYFVQGRLTFGAVVATLTATMGDAAFLLLAREPSTGLLVFVMGFAVGNLTGWVVDLIHDKEFLRPASIAGKAGASMPGSEPDRRFGPMAIIIFLVLLLPGLALGLMEAFQVEMAGLVSESLMVAIGVCGAVFSVGTWLFSTRKMSNSLQKVSCDQQGRRALRGRHLKLSNAVARSMRDTGFITSWVLLGFLVYELAVHFTGADMKLLASAWTPLLPLIGVLVGFFPGCGPQVLVTSLYLAGALPLSAQLGNAISNDGDALFPALALAPRAALIATLYSAVPAVMLAYGWYLFVE